MEFAEPSFKGAGVPLWRNASFEVLQRNVTLNSTGNWTLVTSTASALNGWVVNDLEGLDVAHYDFKVFTPKNRVVRVCVSMCPCACVNAYFGVCDVCLHVYAYNTCNLVCI